MLLFFSYFNYLYNTQYPQDLKHLLMVDSEDNSFIKGDANKHLICCFNDNVIAESCCTSLCLFCQVTPQYAAQFFSITESVMY